MGENSLQKLMTTKLVLQRILEGILWTEKKSYPRGIRERINNDIIMIYEVVL